MIKPIIGFAISGNW